MKCLDFVHVYVSCLSQCILSICVAVLLSLQGHLPPGAVVCPPGIPGQPYPQGTVPPTHGYPMGAVPPPGATYPPPAGAYPPPSGAYPAQPGAYPAQPGAYPAQPGAYPGQPSVPAGSVPYPGAPAGYPGQPGPPGGLFVLQTLDKKLSYNCVFTSFDKLSKATFVMPDSVLSPVPHLSVTICNIWYIIIACVKYF